MDNQRKSRANRIKIGPKRKIAFVCSGGAAKAGAFHLGVALALQEQGFRFYGGLRPKDDTSPRQPDPMEISTYVGSSAGSIICSYLAAGYSLENIFNSFLSKEPSDGVDGFPRPLSRLNYQKMFNLRPETAKQQISQLLQFRKILSKLTEGNLESLLQFRWLKTTGLFTTNGIEQYLRNEVLESNRFEDYLAELFLVATQLNHSRKVVFGRYNYQPPANDLGCQYSNHATISEAAAASTSLPPVYSPYAIKDPDGKVTEYIDGEIRDTLSTHVAIDAGADLVIASYTHQPYHYTKDLGSLSQYGVSAILVQSLYLLIEQKINNHRRGKEEKNNAIDAVSAYCRQQGLAEEHRKRICEILEAELHHRREVDTIYIHPNPYDSRMFIREHFSLSPRKMTEIVKSGFRAAIDTLRKYEFEDRLVSERPVPVAATGSDSK